MSDISERVQNDIAEQLSGKSGSSDDLRHEIEHLEHDFDFDSYAPYTNQEIDVISELDCEYSQEAEDICGGQTYTAMQWEEARRAYAAALAYTAYSSIWEQTKQELIEAIEEFETDAMSAGCDDPQITLALTCVHGWAAHDREDSDGTMYFESAQLDGCNGLARQACGVWMSVCFAPNAESEAQS